MKVYQAGITGKRKVMYKDMEVPLKLLTQAAQLTPELGPNSQAVRAKE